MTDTPTSAFPLSPQSTRARGRFDFKRSPQLSGVKSIHVQWKTKQNKKNGKKKEKRDKTKKLNNGTFKLLYIAELHSWFIFPSNMHIRNAYNSSEFERTRLYFG